MPEAPIRLNGSALSDRFEEPENGSAQTVSYTFPKRMYLLSSPCALHSASDRSDMLLKVVCSGNKQTFYSAADEAEAEIRFGKNEAEMVFPDGTEILRFSKGEAAFGAASAYAAVYTCSGREYPIILKKGRVIAEFFPVSEDKNACGALAASRREVAEATAVYCALERLRDLTGFSDTRL